MPEFDHLIDQKTVLLTTFRKDGRPASTPINVVVTGGRAYFRTFDQSWKAKHLSRNPAVEVTPSTPKGEPTGPAMRCGTRPVPDAETDAIRRLLGAKHPVRQRILVPIYHKVKHYRTLYFELLPETGAQD